MLLPLHIGASSKPTVKLILKQQQQYLKEFRHIIQIHAMALL